VDEARKKILKGQVGFIDRLLDMSGDHSKEDIPTGQDSPVQRSLF
jgi:hypothetical protein